MWICGYRILDTSPWGLAQVVKGWGGFVGVLGSSPNGDKKLPIKKNTGNNPPKVFFIVIEQAWLDLVCLPVFLFVHRDEWLLFQSLNFRLSYHLELLYISQSWFSVYEDLENSGYAVKKRNFILPYVDLELHLLNIPHYENYSSPKPTPIPPLLLPAPLSSQNAFCKNCFRERFLGIHLI